MFPCKSSLCFKYRNRTANQTNSIIMLQTWYQAKISLTAESVKDLETKTVVGERCLSVRLSSHVCPEMA